MLCVVCYYSILWIRSTRSNNCVLVVADVNVSGSWKYRSTQYSKNNMSLDVVSNHRRSAYEQTALNVALSDNTSGCCSATYAAITSRMGLIAASGEHLDIFSYNAK